MEACVVEDQLFYANTETGIIRVLGKGQDAAIEIQSKEGLLKPEDYDPRGR